MGTWCSSTDTPSRNGNDSRENPMSVIGDPPQLTSSNQNGLNFGGVRVQLGTLDVSMMETSELPEDSVVYEPERQPQGDGVDIPPQSPECSGSVRPVRSCRQKGQRFNPY